MKTTKILIIRTFEQLLRRKKLEHITVTQIVESCDINRKTFYYYFRDIDDLLEKAFDYEIDTFIKSISKDIDVYEGIEMFFNFVSENKDIIYHVENSSDTENIEMHFYRTIYGMIRDDVERKVKGRDVTEEQTDIITGIYVHTAVGFIVQWLDDGMKENPTEFFRELDKIVSGALPLMLDNCEKINSAK